MTERWYPQKIVAGTMDSGRYEEATIDFLTAVYPEDQADDFCVAEIGIWKGATTLKIAELLDNRGTIHLFDYDDNVAAVVSGLEERGYTNVIGWGSSYKYLDSYNWNLKRLLEVTTEPVFDYVYVDGAHTWAIDGLAYFLCDLLLKPGGYLDFDDYGWRLRGSSLDPAKVPETRDLYTEDQIDAYQVRAIIDLLVRRNAGYREVVRNRIFQKLEM